MNIYCNDCEGSFCRCEMEAQQWLKKVSRPHQETEEERMKRERQTYLKEKEIERKQYGRPIFWELGDSPY